MIKKSKIADRFFFLRTVKTGSSTLLSLFYRMALRHEMNILFLEGKRHKSKNKKFKLYNEYWKIEKFKSNFELNLKVFTLIFTASSDSWEPLSLEKCFYGSEVSRNFLYDVAFEHTTE